MRDVKMIKYINDLIPSFLNIVKDKNKWQGPALGARSYIYCTVLYCTVQNCTVLYCTVLYCKKLENLQRTDRQTDRQTENSKPEATLIPCGSSGGGAGQYSSYQLNN